MFQVQDKYRRMVKWTIIAIVAMTVSALIASAILVAVRPHPELGEVFKGWLIVILLLASILVEPFIKGTPLGRGYVEIVRTVLRLILVAPIQIVDRIFRRR